MSSFLYAGVACKRDVLKVRWANDEKRIAALVKDGQSDIRLVELPQPMSKLDSAKYISTLDPFQDAEAQYAILAFIKTEEAKLGKVSKVEKEPAAIVANQVDTITVVETLDELVSEVIEDELEDLPY